MYNIYIYILYIIIYILYIYYYYILLYSFTLLFLKNQVNGFQDWPQCFDMVWPCVIYISQLEPEDILCKE